VEDALTKTGSDFSAWTLNTHYKVAGPTRNRVSGGQSLRKALPPLSLQRPQIQWIERKEQKVLLSTCRIHEIRA
jgi:hypothetical protein